MLAVKEHIRQTAGKIAVYNADGTIEMVDYIGEEESYWTVFCPDCGWDYGIENAQRAFAIDQALRLTARGEHTCKQV